MQITTSDAAIAVDAQGSADLAARLGDAGFRAAVISPRGVGGSSGLRAGLDLHDYARDVAHVIEALGGPAHLVGHAFGNRVVRCLARDRPELVRSLVLLGAGGLVPPACDAPAIWRQVITGERTDPARIAAIQEGFFAAASDPTPWLDWALEALGSHAEAAGTPLAAWWDGGSAPMLVVQGREDRMAPPENALDLRTRFGDRVQLAEVPGAGHALLPEQPQLVAALIVHYLAAQGRVEPAERATSEPSPRYALGYSAPMVRYLAGRSAASRARFFLDRLDRGMRVIDCGCGPGTMTLDLAASVAPGPVIGIDIEASQVARAGELAAQRGIGNVRFQVASVHALPFADGSFDAAFLHTLLMHLADPLSALREAYRVLAPGGFIGVVDGDWGCDVHAPPVPVLEATRPLTEQLLQRRGMQTRLGRRHRALLREAGFVDVVGSASVEAYGSPDANREFAEFNAGMAEAAGAAANPGVDRELTARVAAAWRSWGEHPDGLFVRLRCEGLGRRPGG
ncbi:MAG: alpha/beta fold hydrolase [Deltaproteobacteria bacterium]|nr:MAG: alpha/beta fold hydrolase [Deltaproteobacteria bacterium]